MEQKQATSWYHHIENGLGTAALFLLALIPFMEVIAQNVFKTGIPNSTPYIYHLVVFITFVAGIIAARKKEHLSLSISFSLSPSIREHLDSFTMFLAVTLTSAFGWCALSFSRTAFEPEGKIGVFPIQWVGYVMVIGYFVMAIRFFLQSPRKLWSRIWVGFGFLLGLFLAVEPLHQWLTSTMEQAPPILDSLLAASQSFSAWAAMPLVILLIIGAAFGTPLFVVLGGIAFLLFAKEAQPLAAIPNEAYSMLISHSIPAIPLFTLAGFILSESKAGERLVRFFKACFSWIPGGLAVMTIMVCSFFTTFTGASGVTILALGALLSFVLINGKYERKFSIGLLTGSGSVGLLFPPSLPIIIYGVVAGVNIKHLFIGGIVPGFVLILSLTIYSIIYASRRDTIREKFNLREALHSFYGALGEILLPVVIMVVYFGGITNRVEDCAAIAVVYAFILEVFIHRDLKLKTLPGVFLKCLPIIGGVLMILSLAKGLSYYIVDAQIPMQLMEWVSANISSKYVFLLLLNLVLLITGCLMDIFSAIMVVVPLIVPLGAMFGIDPVHLGIIFLANMELGYMTPPVGMNLFLASYRFGEPMSKLYKEVLPFLFLQLLAVLLITYVPVFSTGLLAFVR